MNRNERDLGISFIRFFSMIMIVVCHMMQYLENELAWWFNVGVQIFFIISGFLYGQKEIDNGFNWIKKRLKKILSTYYVYIIIITSVYFVFVKDLFSINQTLKNILCVQYFIGGMVGLEHLWFITFIIICYFITPILQSIYENMLKGKNEIEFWITFIFILISIQFIKIIGLININIPNLSCYIIGYFISRRYFNLNYKDDNDKMKLLNFLIIFTFLSIVSNGIVIYLRYVKKVDGMEIGNLMFDYSHMLLGMSLFLIMYWGCKKINLKQCNLLNFSDKYSFEIYIVHQFYILGLFSMMNLTSNLVLNILVIIVSIVISAYALKYLTNIILNIFNNIYLYRLNKINVNH